MKKFLKITLYIIILLISTACGNNNVTDAEKFKYEYESLNNNSVAININEDNPIKYVNFEDLIEILTTGTGVIYFGFPGCPWCRNVIPVLFDVADFNNIDTIYYFNPKDIRTSGDEQYQKLINILDNYLLENEQGEKTLYVPDVYFVKNGKIVGNHLSTVDSQTDPYISLTEEQTKDLENIYQNLFKQLR